MGNKITRNYECRDNFKKVNNICEQVLKKFKSTIKSTVSTITYDPEMEDRNSPEFKNAAATFCDEWKAKLGPKLASCVVLKISQSVSSKRSAGAEVEADLTINAENLTE